MATMTRIKLRQRQGGASYDDRGTSIGVFLVWFCHFGTEALYWDFFFFLINTVLLLVCFAFALYRLYQCIGDWFSLQ